MVQEADRLGYHSVWSAEAYGSDAVTPITWVAAHTTRIKVGTAIMQIPARTPTLTATTALTLDQLSGGRFLLGLGVSGPSGGRGLARRRLRQAARAHARVRGDRPRGVAAGEGARVHGRVLPDPVRRRRRHGPRQAAPVHPARARGHPRLLAAIGPKNVALAAEIADGWLPVFFSPERMSVWKESLESGFRAAGGGKSLARFDVAPTVPVVIGPDAQACRDAIKPRLALYVGGMGARGRNFYNDLVRRYGYEDAAAAIQNLYLSGKKQEAAAAVPDALVDEVALCGPRERIAERLSRWTGSGVTTLICGMTEVGAVRTMAELVL